MKVFRAAQSVSTSLTARAEKLQRTEERALESEVMELEIGDDDEYLGREM